jgi:2'-5' RNA ligase
MTQYTVQKNVASDSAVIMVPAPDVHLASVVESIIGQKLDAETEPHVTVLYLGSGISRDALPEIEAAMRDATATMRADSLMNPLLTAFSHGEDGTPIVLEFADPKELEGLNNTLIRGLTHLITAKQFPTYRAHLTIGYAPNPLTSDQIEQLHNTFVGQVKVPITKVELRYGKELIATADVGYKLDILRRMHRDLHLMYRLSNDDGQKESIASRHADVVDELMAAGAPHPEPPADGLDDTLELIPTMKSIPIRKSNDEKRLVYGVVLQPNILDGQNEWEKPETIERTAQQFLAEYNRVTELGIQHKTFGEIGVELAESYIAPQDLDFDGELEGDDIIIKGSWVMVVHITSDAVWQKVKDGLITGFSVRGIATVRAS